MTDANGPPVLDFGPVDESFFAKAQYAAASDAVAVLYTVQRATKTTSQPLEYELVVGSGEVGARYVSYKYATRQEAIAAANEHYRANRRTP